MPIYKIGSHQRDLTYYEGQAVKSIFTQAASKLRLDSPTNVIVCDARIDHQWLGQVVKEVERWYLDDYDMESDSISIPKDDIKRFKEFQEFIETIVEQNHRKKDKYITRSQSEDLVGKWSDFCLEFHADDESDEIISCGSPISRRKLAQVVKDVKVGIEQELAIVWHD